jgi:hypothetical protein
MERFLWTGFGLAIGFTGPYETQLVTHFTYLWS